MKRRKLYLLSVLGAALMIFGCGQQDFLGPEVTTSETLDLPSAAKHQPTAGYSYFFIDVDDIPSAIANNGDEIDIGLTTSPEPFTFHPKDVSGGTGGDFTIKNAGGDVLSEGTWTATKLISFKSYGFTAGLGPDLPDPVFAGSLILPIELSTGPTGILKLTCTDFGDPPPGAHQGMTLQIVGGQHFTGEWFFPPTEPTAGFTFFVEN